MNFMANDIDGKSQPDRPKSATSGRSSLRTQKDATGPVMFVVPAELSDGAVFLMNLPTKGLEPGQNWIKGQADPRNFESPSPTKVAVAGPSDDQTAVPNVAKL
jgi:hypothetical protein